MSNFTVHLSTVACSSHQWGQEQYTRTYSNVFRWLWSTPSSRIWRHVVPYKNTDASSNVLSPSPGSMSKTWKHQASRTTFIWNVDELLLSYMAPHLRTLQTRDNLEVGFSNPCIALSRPAQQACRKGRALSQAFQKNINIYFHGSVDPVRTNICYLLSCFALSTWLKLQILIHLLLLPPLHTNSAPTVLLVTTISVFLH